jgi:4-hydroxybenzoate polyprenyltransferase
MATAPAASAAQLLSAAGASAHLTGPAAASVARLLAKRTTSTPASVLVAAGATAVYAATCLRAQTAVVRDPSAPRVRAAVGAGIHALLPLQAALVARAGAPLLALPLTVALPVVGRLARKVSST